MKKLITLMLLAFAITTFAQRNSGFKVGYSIGWVSPTVTAVIPNSEAMYETSSLNEMLLGYSWNIQACALPVWADVNRDDAASMAQRASGGRVLAVERAERDGRAVWRVKVLTPQGEVKVMLIDVASGRTN